MVQIGVQTGLIQEAPPEGLRNELYQARPTPGGTADRQTQIVKALHDGAGLRSTTALEAVGAVADEQFGQLAGIVAAPVIIRQVPPTGVAGDLISVDAANWDTCEWFLAGVPTSQAVTVPSFTLPGVAGDYFCRFTNATGTTDTGSVTVA